MQLRILSGGAANGLVNRVREAFRDRTGLGIAGDFGAVGGMRERIAGGEAVDLAILTRAAIDALVEEGRLDGGSVADLGRVETGIAVKEGAELPSVADAEALAEVLRGAEALFCPDTGKATAGIHFASVLERLGLHDPGRLREFPNGQTAMAAMAESDLAAPVGCTQVTEILNTPGVAYAGPLPPPHDLSTTYSAAISREAARPGEARALISLLTDPGAAELRRSVGFT